MEWVVSFTPQPLYPRGRAPSTHWTGGWVGPNGGLYTVDIHILIQKTRKLRSHPLIKLQCCSRFKVVLLAQSIVTNSGGRTRRFNTVNAGTHHSTRSWAHNVCTHLTFSSRTISMVSSHLLCLSGRFSNAFSTKIICVFLGSILATYPAHPCPYILLSYQN